MSLCGIDHVFVSVSCLCVGFLSSRGFISSCRFDVFAWFHVFVMLSDFCIVSYLRVVFRSSRRPRIQHFPANFFHSSPILLCRGSLFNAEHVAAKQQHARPSAFSFHVFSPVLSEGLCEGECHTPPQCLPSLKVVI